jgi:hypothetical protein
MQSQDGSVGAGVRAPPHVERIGSTRAHRLSCMGLAAAHLWALGAIPVTAQMAHHHHPKAERSSCQDATLACASTATPAFGPNRSLWLAFAAGDRVLVARSPDLGRSFSTPTSVTPEPQQLDWGPDARPKIVVDQDGRIFVAYAIFKDKAFNGQVHYSYSTDSGASFVPPRPITSDPESQRFEVLALDPSGKVFAAWLDKRNRAPAKAKGEKYVGAALAFAWLSETKADIGEAALAQDNTCECCRLGVAFAGPGRPVLLFRNVFDGSVRDHAVITFADPLTPGPLFSVSNDDWRTDACPHHGPSLGVAPNGTYHAAWFTNGRARQGLFYARSVDAGRTFSQPMPLGAADRQPARPSVLAQQHATWLTWKEFNGESTVLMAMASRDDGRSWTAAREIARTDGDSDHPLLVSNGEQAFVSWLTRREGYRLLPLDANL